MRCIIYIIGVVFIFNLAVKAQQSPFERSHKTASATYPQAIAFYKGLAKKYSKSKLISFGSTDFGLPLHLFVMADDGVFDPTAIKKK